MVTAPYFLATKLAAFDARGKGDFMMSHDMEDIIAVIDGRPELATELHGVEVGLRDYLAGRFAELLGDDNFLASVPGHLQGGTVSPDRTPVVLGIIAELAASTP